MYDRRQKKKNQKKWCDLVAHIAQKPLPVNQMARKITVFISAPPGDGIRPSREFFKEYVKPVLVAAAMDYDVIEGRKEGDVRYGTAEQIRRLRRKSGEANSKSEVVDSVKVLEDMRERMQITLEPATGGDLVLGRHTWKEYVRGLHEGWLGPIDESPEPVAAPSPDLPVISDASPIHNIGEPNSDQTKPETDTEPEKAPEEEPAEEKKKPYPPPSYLSSSTYGSASLAAATPAAFEPSQAIHQYHLLGFLRTPIRIWNYLNQRKLADRIGQETAAIVMAASRPYNSPSDNFAHTRADDSSPTTSTDTSTNPSSQSSEQTAALSEDEGSWHKSVWKKAKKEDDDAERIWTTDVILDDRIASRMRKFELSFEEAARAERIGNDEEKGRAYEVKDLRKDPVKKDLAYEDD